MQPDSARRFRRTTRRLASQFIAGKIGYSTYISAVRSAAVHANLIPAPGKRRNRQDRILDTLAWSISPVPPGELPAVLEPHLAAFERGDIEFHVLQRHVTDSIARASIRRPGLD